MNIFYEMPVFVTVKIRNPDKPELRVITKKLPGMYIYEKKIPQSDSSVAYLYSE
jgi:hypothetical protein